MLDKIKAMEKFVQFKNAWYELSEVMDEAREGDELMSGHYPFDGCFREMRGAVKQWTQTSIEALEIKTFEDMQKSRSFLPVDIFEDLQKQDVDQPEGSYIVSYFDSYYIGIEGTVFTLHLMNQDYSSESLAELEKILWDDFLIDEMNTSH